jgi:hypothetical protein
MRMTISDGWTPEERMKVASILLSEIQKDIYAGKYSWVGRPNITSVQHVLNAEAAILNQNRESLNAMLEGIA